MINEGKLATVKRFLITVQALAFHSNEGLTLETSAHFTKHWFKQKIAWKCKLVSFHVVHSSTFCRLLSSALLLHLFVAVSVSATVR